ncbi:M56 family metallopeptidase [Brevibacillus reuszeri]|uniref:M56 family metallopeptidase n=1 Tax=Brevibacillus reuszeri TaxID=54915 RepID=UPI002899084F|nr:M56 family metallopeptidase [Brevibacillus reuszeri]
MMLQIYVPLLLMSIVAALLYLVLRLCIRLNQKHFTATWLYYVNVLIYAFYLIPFYMLYSCLDHDFLKAASSRFTESPTLNKVLSITYSPDWKAESFAVTHESSFSSMLLIEFIPYMLVAGTVIFLLVILFQNIAFHRRISRLCEQAEDPIILNELAICQQKLGIKKEIPVYLSPYCSTPFLYGIGKPSIVLPATMDFSGEQYHQIFLHELTHYKRHDTLLKCLFIVTNALHWFNPLAYLARRDIDRYCELSCDEKIVQSMNEGERKRYGQLLLSVLWNAAQQKGGIYSAFSNTRKYMERRIQMIWGNKPVKRKKSALVLTMCALLSVACISTAFAYSGSQQAIFQSDASPQASASKAGTYIPDESIVLEGEVGTTLRRGDLIFERIGNDSHAFPEKVDAILANTSQSHLIKKSEGDEYCTIWVNNEGSRHVIFTVTKATPSGTAIPGSIVKIPAQTTWKISTLQPFTKGEYYANFTSGQAIMSGQVAFTFQKKE